MLRFLPVIAAFLGGYTTMFAGFVMIAGSFLLSQNNEDIAQVVDVIHRQTRGPVMVHRAMISVLQALVVVSVCIGFFPGIVVLSVCWLLWVLLMIQDARVWQSFIIGSCIPASEKGIADVIDNVIRNAVRSSIGSLVTVAIMMLLGRP